MALDAGTRPDGSLDVLIVCPHRLERESLRLAVEQDEEMGVVGLAADAAAAMELARRPGADVVVLGWGWEAGECIELLERLHAQDGALPVIVISADLHPGHVQRAVQAGARGFLPADVDLDDLIHAVRSAAGGDQMILHRSLAPAFLSHLATEGPPHSPHGPFDSLTRREQEVVRLLARGLGDRDLAQTLFISVRTVQTHLSHIYAKLGVHTRTEVALMAVREGWASLPSPGEVGP